MSQFMPTSRSSATPEYELLEAAAKGDANAFRCLIEPYRAPLHAHCYRMLGSVHDADDVLQEVLLRTWRNLSRFERGRPLRPWLYKIATNACLSAIGRRPKRQLPVDTGPPSTSDAPTPVPEHVWIEPYPDDQIGIEDGYAAPHARYEQREAIELAFVAALQHLSAHQRAVLILREVLGFSAREAAHSLDTTVASVNSALQRARKTLDLRLPERSQQATLRSLGDESVRNLVEQFIHAFESGNVDAILSMLTHDATFSMPPYPGWRRGRAAIADSWLMPGGPPPRLRYVPTSANGQPALGTYLLNAKQTTFLPIALDVLTLEGALIADVIAFRTPEVFPRFGLPATIPYRLES